MVMGLLSSVTFVAHILMGLAAVAGPEDITVANWLPTFFQDFLS
jgi:hypothetical protein